MRTKKNLLICYSYANEPRPLDPVSSTLSIRHLGFAYFSSLKEIIFSACKSVRVGARARECACILLSDCSTLVRSFFDRSSVRLFAGSSFISINIWKEPFAALLFFNDGNEEFSHRDNASRSPLFFFTSNNLPSQRIFCVQHKMACNPKNIRLGPLSKLGIQQLAITFVVWCSSEMNHNGENS